MADSIRVSDIRFAAASEILRSKELLGWVICSYGEFQLGCIAVRKNADGRYSLGFPTRTDGNEREHPIYRPLDQAARDAIEAQVLGDLRRRGILPPEFGGSTLRANETSRKGRGAP